MSEDLKHLFYNWLSFERKSSKLSQDIKFAAVLWILCENDSNTIQKKLFLIKKSNNYRSLKWIYQGNIKVIRVFQKLNLVALVQIYIYLWFTICHIESQFDKVFPKIIILLLLLSIFRFPINSTQKLNTNVWAYF